MNILLDYLMPISSIEPTPQASTAFLKQVLAIVKPKSGVTPGTIVLTTSQSGVAAVTDNLEVQQLFAAGMSRVYVLPLSVLTGLGGIIEGRESDFYTIIVSSDFTDAEIDAIAIGDFEGVVASSSSDDAKNATRAAVKNTVAFHTSATNKAKNMFFAFGKMLSNPLSWRNQQYIVMPFADDVATLGDANALFDDKISFVLDDTQYGKRLGLFAAGGEAIVAPYIAKNLQIDLQSAALSYISGNQPAYTRTQAALLEDELQKVVAGYIARQLIDAGEIEVLLEQENFNASGYINIAKPSAMWRIFSEMRQTL